MDTKPTVNILWFKRDLRLSDHLPLQLAAKTGTPILPIYIFEPELKSHHDYSQRHWQFVQQSINDLDQKLAEVGSKVLLLHASAIAAFQRLMLSFKVMGVYSHEETGVEVTYLRDLALAKFFEQENIPWIECPSNGVERGRKNRKNWAERWGKVMSEPWFNTQIASTQWLSYNHEIYQLHKPISAVFNPNFQKGGEQEAHEVMQSFFLVRVNQYNKSISKPLQSRTGCSRLSPYLAWGNLSIKQVVQSAERAKEQGANAWQVNSFGSRLRWHCHFIQKFEMEHRMEFEAVNKGMRQDNASFNLAHLEAWKTGKTGYPLVDACMRCLIETGYINFRMRAMLVSVATHHLALPWQEVAKHLAPLFLDFEPGIHYPQVQMQAGLTGINTVRIYNPVKQSIEQDADGEFIKQWVPELSHLPTAHLHQPWLITPIDAAFENFEMPDLYPKPIVDLEKAGREARVRIWNLQKQPEVMKDAKRILARHTIPGRARMQ